MTKYVITEEELKNLQTRLQDWRGSIVARCFYNDRGQETDSAKAIVEDLRCCLDIFDNGEEEE